eukprot:3312317-Amphidinium_carterae.1
MGRPGQPGIFAHSTQGGPVQVHSKRHRCDICDEEVLQRKLTLAANFFSWSPRDLAKGCQNELPRRSWSMTAFIQPCGTSDSLKPR